MADIEKLFENEEFLAKFDNASSKEEVLKIFNDNGIDFDAQQLDEFVSYAASKSGELGENDLDDVSGGMGLGAAIAAFGAAKKTIDKAANKFSKTSVCKKWKDIVDND